MKTIIPRQDSIERKWYLIDAEGQILGRMSTKIANILRGKEKATFTPHMDTGDFVVVINAEKVKLTGKKDEQMTYKHYSGYPGGMKEEPLEMLRKRHPDRIIRHAVAGMMPKNRLGRAMIRKLKIYAGSKHPHEAQRPIVVNL